MNKEELLQLRKDKKLHGLVEDRLKVLFDSISSNLYTLKEAIGTTSGRTDTTTFSGDGKIIHVEFIASESMVFRDLTNLHQSSADLQIAVVIDEKYDPLVPKAYFSANGKNQFQMFWMSEILDPEQEERTKGRLDQLIRTSNRESELIQQQVRDEFNFYIQKLKYDPQKHSIFNVGFFPRKQINIFGDSLEEDQIFEYFNKLGGVQPIIEPGWGGYGGFGFGNSHNGKYFVIYTPHDEGFRNVQIGVGRTGGIFLTYAFESQEKWLVTSWYPQMINPTLNFIHTAFDSKYNGMIDMLFSFTNVENKVWLRDEQTAQYARSINMYSRLTYEKDIMSDISSLEFSTIAEEQTKKRVIDLINNTVHLNTKKHSNLVR